MVTLSATSAAPGDQVHILSRFNWTDCYDGGQPGTPPAEQGLAVVLEVRGATSYALATVDPDPQGTVDLTVEVPADAPAGPATLTVGHGHAVLEIVNPVAEPRARP